MSYYSTIIGAAELSPLEQLGKKLFFDTNLSNPRGQACASCHDPKAGFSSPLSSINAQGAVHPGAEKSRFGNRKPPTVSYAKFSPKFQIDPDSGDPVGGQFWDGRAADLVAQAAGPLLNPLEQNNANAREVLGKVSASEYKALYEQVFGEGTLTDNTENAKQALPRITQAIAAYESSREVNPFSSKYDAFLAGKVQLSEREQRGLALFEGKANCAACHPHKSENSQPPLFTDFSYDNLGVPRNPNNPFYRQPKSINPDGDKYVDLGLGAVRKDEKLYANFKVPTLRNVDKRPNAQFVKAYMHNGFFKSLKEVVHFYNVRDAKPNEFPPPEYADNVNREELGKLGLTNAEEDDIVAFLKTLSDGYGQQQLAGDPATPPLDEGPATQINKTPNFQNAGNIIRVQNFQINQRIAAEEAKKTRR